ncbi:MAG: hypothetical protein ACLP3B_12780 [Syntrophobacteraceae bacterium]
MSFFYIEIRQTVSVHEIYESKVFDRVDQKYIGALHIFRNFVDRFLDIGIEVDRIEDLNIGPVSCNLSVMIGAIFMAYGRVPNILKI